MELGDTFSMLLAESAKKHHWKGAGPLSLKLYLTGKATFKVDDRSYIIDEQSYLVLNKSEPYEVIIDEEKEAEAFCIFFQRNLLSEYLRSHKLSNTELLDQPVSSNNKSFEFSQHTFRRNHIIDSKIYELKSAVNVNVDSLSLEILLQDILQELVNTNHVLKEKEQRLDFVKKTTREELIKRLLTARDFIHAYYQKSITLDDIAKASCLSANHMLRTFKQAFGQTPNRYIMKLRIEKAKNLLTTYPDRSISKICIDCGFESVGYFSSLFKRYTGVPPSRYRSGHPGK